MKTTRLMKRAGLAALLCGMLALPALAQPGPGWGGGPGAQAGGACAADCGPGMMGGGRGMGRGMRFSQRNTAGWDLMTQEERVAHREKMRAVKSYEECKLIQTEHHQLMEARAKEKGGALPEPRYNGCDRMKARGLIK